MAAQTAVLKLVTVELSRISDRALVEALEPLIVSPRAVNLSWDYGAPGQTYECWVVAEHGPSHTAIAYCEQGFGPADPWGLVTLDSPAPTIGMDSSWYSTLEDAFRQSRACRLAPPDGYEVA